MTPLLLGTLFLVSASLRQEVLQFSSKDVLALREIVAVDGLTPQAASRLLTRTVFDMLSPTTRNAFVVSVDSAEYISSEIAGAALSGVDVCEVAEIAFVRMREPFSPPSLPVYRYFDRIRAIAGSGCDRMSTAARRRAASISPYHTPYTVRPRIRNIVETDAAIEREFPKELRDAGIAGITCIWFYIDRDGDVLGFLIRQTSGRPAMDSAAMRVASIMRFTPALNGDTAVRAWVEFPVWFRAGPSPPAWEQACRS